MTCINSAIAGIRIESTNIPIMSCIDSAITGIKIEPTDNHDMY